MMEKINCYLCLGSNLGDRKKNIEDAISLLAEKVVVVKSSSIYETEPVEYEQQPWFLNCVVKVESSLDALSLLNLVEDIEKRLGRDKTKEEKRYGPRLIDIDILFYGNEIVDSAKLKVPHPKLHERLFVLEPLAEIDSELMHPVLNKSVGKLMEEIKSEGFKDFKIVRKFIH